VNIGTGKAYFSHGHKLNYICACTVKFYDILKIKNPFVESVYYHTNYGTCQLVQENQNDAERKLVLRALLHS
jgi:hypothetical protein